MGGSSRDGKLRSLDRSTMSSCNTTVSSEGSCVGREVKVVVVGPAKTGKTSLIQRFVDDRFSNTYVPTNFEKYTTKGFVNNVSIQYSIWDTSGQVNYDSIRPLAYPDAHVFILCFNIADPDSFHMAIRKWLPEIRLHCPDTPFVFCGCGSDLRNDVRTLAKLAQSNYGEPIAKEYAIRNAEQMGAVDYIETSSAYGDDKGIYEVFAVAAKAGLAHMTINMIYENAVAEAAAAASLPKVKHNTLSCMRFGRKKKDSKTTKEKGPIVDSEMFIYNGLNDQHLREYYRQQALDEPEFKNTLTRKAKNCTIM